jgi:hypothetical protein
LLGLLCRWDGNPNNEIDCRRAFSITEPKNTYAQLINSFSNLNDADSLFSGNGLGNMGESFAIKNFAELKSFLKSDNETECIFIFNRKKQQWSCLSKNMIVFL